MAFGTPFQPGQSGNPNGRPKSKPFADALKAALKAMGDDKEALQSVANSLVVKARSGDVAAIKEIADRLDGKVPQGLIGGEEGDSAITVSWLSKKS